MSTNLAVPFQAIFESALLSMVTTMATMSDYSKKKDTNGC